MKKLIGHIIAVIAILSIGYFLGYFVSIFNDYINYHEYSKRQEEFQARTQDYQPTCEELNKIGISEIIKKGNDNFFINVEKEYFTVYGFNIEPGRSPVTAWWGGGRAEAIRQTCK